MCEPHKYNVEQKKPDAKECILYDCIYVNFKDRLNCLWCQKLGD